MSPLAMGGNAGSSHGAGSFLRESIGASRTVGAGGTVVVRTDSAFYSAGAITACRDNGAHFLVTTKMDPKIKAAIASIPESAWVPIANPRAVFDEQASGWMSDTQVAEIPSTAFTAKESRAVTARLIVCRASSASSPRPTSAETSATWRYHPVFTDSPSTCSGRGPAPRSTSRSTRI